MPTPASAMTHPGEQTLRRRAIELVLAMSIASCMASPAYANAFYFDIGGATLDPDTGDRITVEVLLDASYFRIQMLSVSVMATSSVFRYDPVLSSQSTYILYSPNIGRGLSSVYLVPPGKRFSQSPDWSPVEWPTPPPGLTQVNIEFVEKNLSSTRKTGLGIVLATLVFEVLDGDMAGSLALSLDETGDLAGGNIFRIDLGREHVDIADEVTLGPAITIIPEPASLVLVASGLFMMAALSRGGSQQ